jgi:hypothetical protein
MVFVHGTKGLVCDWRYQAEMLHHAAHGQRSQTKKGELRQQVTGQGIVPGHYFKMDWNMWPVGEHK